jgi:hypothetical protein
MLFLMGLTKEIMPVLRDPSCRKHIYLFDTWEPDWEFIEAMLRSAKSLHCVLMSSSQAAEHFRERLDCMVHWVPQAAISSEFSPQALNWSRKKKRILNIGRTNRRLNDFFLAFSEKHGFEYLRDEYPGQMMFKTRSAFLQALYESQIVVVHPRNREYPEFTGRVSMLTARNFEAYQSGGIVCGFRPDSGEFESVFDGFPFVDFIDAEQFEVALLSELKNADRWVAASEKCMDQHTWERRFENVEQICNAGQ